MVLLDDFRDCQPRLPRYAGRMTAAVAAAIFERMALMLEMQGENPFKVRAYRQTAELLRDQGDPLLQRLREGDAEVIRGIGSTMRGHLHDWLQSGKIPLHEQLCERYPESLFALFELQGLGAKKIAKLFHECQISSLADLKLACEQGRIAQLTGFGEKTQQKLLLAMAERAQHQSLFHLNTVAEIATELLDELREHPDVLRVAACGSYRRGKEVIGDLDLLVATRFPAEVIADFVARPGIQRVLAQGETKASVLLENGLQCDFRAVNNAQFPFALSYFTGSKEHNVLLRQRALERGWSLNEYGMSKTRSTAPDVPEICEEEDIYRALELAFIPPELRENRGEIEAAARGPMPRLIELIHLRGTFHNHTTASDGRHSLEEMAAVAQDLGLQYFGISDHSRSSVQANGLSRERLLAQVAAVRAYNEQHAPFRLFAGCEVDILADGQLDYDDEVLAQLDYVVASVHQSMQQDAATMTARIIRAMENPHVTMIGHLSGRLLLKRQPYGLDYPAILEAAAATRTVIELNSNPRRLDMDWRYWPQAQQLGIWCAINPDAHRRGHLSYLHFGVIQARKAGLRRCDVLNALSLESMSAFLATPKAQRPRPLPLP